MSDRRVKRILLIIAIVLVFLLFVFAAAALSYTYKEMRHEGLTYSQWYESSIFVFYSCLVFTVSFSILLVYLLICLLRFGRKTGFVLNSRTKKAALAVAVILSVCLVIITRMRLRAINLAAADGAEALEPYIRSYGNSMVLSAVCVTTTMILAVSIVRNRLKGNRKHEVPSSATKHEVPYSDQIETHRISG